MSRNAFGEALRDIPKEGWEGDYTIPGSPLCPVAALTHHRRFNAVGPSDPLFSVWSGSLPSSRPLTFSLFSSFLARVVAALGLDPQA